MPLMQYLERRLEEATEIEMMEEEEELHEEPLDEDDSPLEGEAPLAKLSKLDE